MTISGVNKAKRGNIVFNGENIENKNHIKLLILVSAKYLKEEEFFQD